MVCCQYKYALIKCPPSNDAENVQRDRSGDASSANIFTEQLLEQLEVDEGDIAVLAYANEFGSKYRQ